MIGHCYVQRLSQCVPGAHCSSSWSTRRLSTYFSSTQPEANEAQRRLPSATLPSNQHLLLPCPPSTAAVYKTVFSHRYNPEPFLRHTSKSPSPNTALRSIFYPTPPSSNRQHALQRFQSSCHGLHEHRLVSLPLAMSTQLTSHSSCYQEAHSHRLRL